MVTTSSPPISFVSLPTARAMPYPRLLLTLAHFSILIGAGWICLPLAWGADAPTVQELFALKTLPEPLVPTLATPSKEENSNLAECLSAFKLRTRSDDFSALEDYLATNPESPWRLAVATNLGLIQYGSGYFSRCIVSFQLAWDAGKDASDLRAKALADRAAGEYVKMLARLGRQEELKAFLEQVKDRQFIGQANESILSGIEGYKTMEIRPEVSFRCGPLALSRILASQQSPKAVDMLIVNSRSSRQGMSLSEVAEISAKLGMNYQPAKRSPGAEFILPSVTHWKSGHYAALIKKDGDQYLAEDPTFKNSTWFTAAALEDESSGYYLVPPGPLPAGWSPVSGETAASIFGKGNVGTYEFDDTLPEDHDPAPPAEDPNPSPGPCGGMAVHSYHTMLASHKITDTPLGYRPPYGLPVNFTLVYAQREANQPSNFNYTNAGPKWNLDWVRYVIDNPANFGTVSLGGGKGGKVIFPIVAGAGGGGGGRRVSLPNPKTRKQISQSVANPLPYEVLNADGSKEIYGQADGSTVAPRKIFLTQRIDPAGNQTSFAYDSQLRITTVTDPLGQQTTLSYELAGDPYKITKVTDPFGRTTALTYDPNGRLIKIRDMIGIESSFTYEGSSDFIDSMTTPYGTSVFTDHVDGLIRRVTATDPAGDTEVLETVGNNAPTPSSEPAAPEGMAAYNSYLHYRDSFFWNKKQWKENPEDYTKAHIYHWHHGENFNELSGTLESEKPPLQSRIWYNYPGQAASYVPGTSTTPSAIGRVVEGGSQLTLQTVNDRGTVTSRRDPLGRLVTYTYDETGIDLLNIESHGTLATYTYNAQHRPLTYTDAAGQVTTYAWNATGQITSVTNAKNETTNFSYYPASASGKQRKGRLYQIDGALAGNSDIVTFDYDATGNVSDVTGPDGYHLAFAFDGLDRLTRTTFPDATYTETTYQALDPKTSRDRLGRVTTYVYNSIRQLESVTDPANRTIGYRWCKCGALSQLIDAMGRITKWKHDAAGRMTAKIYADGSQINYGYQPLSGRLSTITDEKGQVKTHSYNLDNTLAGIGYTHEEHETPDVAFTYDTDFRRIKTMLDGIGTTTYGYNPVAPGTFGAGKLASVDGPLLDDTLTYSYDGLGRNTGYAINGVGETRTLDPLGRLLTAVNPLGTFGYTYAGAASRMDKVTYPNGMICKYTYHPLAGDFRLKDILYTMPGNSQLSRQSYEYNDVGNITRWTQISPQAGLNRSWLCGYDAADQLTSVASQDPETLAALPTGQYGYTYDFAGNRLTETIDGVTATASVNSLNQLTSLTSAGASALPQQTYEWNADNRLKAINYFGTNERSEFEYDGNGRQITVREKQGLTVTADRRFVWQGLQLAEERHTAADAVKKRYFAGGMQISGSGAALVPRLFVKDHLGSVRGVLSGNNTFTTAYDFDPWGRRIILANLPDESSLGFTGHFFHSSNLVLAPFRAYAAASGKWISRDQIAENGGINLYAYVSGNPISAVDPLGYFDWKRLSKSADYGAQKQFTDALNPFNPGDATGAIVDLRLGRLAKTPLSYVVNLGLSGIVGGLTGAAVDVYLQHEGLPPGYPEPMPKPPSYPAPEFFPLPLPPLPDGPLPVPEPPPIPRPPTSFGCGNPFPLGLPPPPFFWGY